MNSLEWRVKKLENKILGSQANRLAGNAHLNQLNNQQDESISDQLNKIAKCYKGFIDTDGEKYTKFVELYERHKNLLNELDKTNDDVSETAKAELVLAYEEDLIRHLEALRVMAEKADRVLNVDKWPDLSGYKQQLDKLEKITKEQHLQSMAIDKKTEELIEIYNDIIGSFKSNTVLWNNKLEAFENEEKKLDEDE